MNNQPMVKKQHSLSVHSSFLFCQHTTALQSHTTLGALLLGRKYRWYWKITSDTTCH